MSDIADQVVAAVAKPNYQPVKAKALARKLGIPQVDYPNFRRLIKQLVKEGRLVFGKNHVLKAAHEHGSITGVFRRAESGFGFVRLELGQLPGVKEIFIPAAASGNASTGDEVLVRITRKPNRADKSPEGEIIRVLERATHQFVGTYLERDGEAYVRVDGTLFAEPIFVGDPGAKGAKPEEKVVIEMVRFPSPVTRGEAVVVEVLGPLGQPGVDLQSIIKAFNLPEVFPEDVLQEARRKADTFDEGDLDGRQDFREQLVITIDPADAKDHDDAVSLEFDPGSKHWMLYVHIADVGHFAPAGSMLDREARKRGNSVYLPGKVLPMFPEVISNALASLQEGRVRYVLSVAMEFTEAGIFVRSDFVRGVIKVKRRFSYEQVSALLKPGASDDTVSPELLAMLRRMETLATLLLERRRKRGMLELEMPEVELDYDSDGRVKGAHFHHRDFSHRIIEEFMLAANEAVATHLHRLGIAFLRRNHAAPDAVKLQAFLEFAKLLGYEVNVRQPMDRFQLQRVLTESVNRPERHAVHYAMLRSLKQAEYSPYEDGHYALASQHYCHFTSPIRRYPDLTVHRLITQWLRAGRAGSDETELVAIGEHCSLTERTADRAEQELIKLKLLTYLSERIGTELEIIITSVEDFGFFGQCPTLPVEGLVHVSGLTDDYYYYDGASHSLVGRRTQRRFRLGDTVKVKVARVDLQRRQLDFRLVEGPPPKPARSGRRKRDTLS
jgi:ribonuclease R